MGGTCAECRFAKRTEDDELLCRRNPPQVFYDPGNERIDGRHYSAWPPVEDSWECGEWRRAGVTISAVVNPGCRA